MPSNWERPGHLTTYASARRLAKKIPLARLLHRLLLGRSPVSEKRDKEIYDIDYISVPSGVSLIKSKHSGAAYFFPYPSRVAFNRIQMSILRNGFDEHLRKKYSEGPFMVDPGDTVIDCGGFVGGFTVAAIGMGADRVFHVEPTPITRRCAALNFLLHDCADRVVQFAGGLSNTTTTMKLNLSDSFADNSFMDPDEGATGEAIDVPITTVEALAASHGLEAEETFLKVEAEGFEVEVVKGMGAFRPRTLAVDVTPERGGESPREEIREILSAMGYTAFADTRRCLFASQP